MGMIMTGVIFLINPAETVTAEVSLSDTEITLDPESGNSNNFTVEVPKGVYLTDFNLGIEGKVDPNTDMYPRSVKMAVGDDTSYIWSWDGEGKGAMGLQTEFDDGASTDRLVFNETGTKTGGTLLIPKNAQIADAEIALSVEDNIIMEDPVRINLEWMGPNPVEGTYFDYDVTSCVHDSKLWAAWRTYNPSLYNRANQTQGALDNGIVISYSSDGRDWAKPFEITPMNSNVECWTPHMVSHGGKLHVVFESNDTDYTSGQDRDIVIVSSSTPTNANSWSSPVEITKNEASYSLHKQWNEGLMDWTEGPMDWWPRLVSHSGKLYCVWTTQDTSTPNSTTSQWGGMNGFGNDIVVSSSSDGSSWSTPYVLTQNNRPYDIEAAPKLFSLKGKLFCAWYSNSSVLAGEGFNDYDTLVSWSTGGSSWSPITQLSPIDGTQNPDSLNPADEPPFLPYYHMGQDMTPVLVEYDNEVFAIWKSSDGWITHWGDYDITMMNGGDGTQWNVPVMPADHTNGFGKDTSYGRYREVTPMRTTDDYHDRWPQAVVNNDRLYVFWQTDDPRIANVGANFDKDLVFRSTATNPFDWDPRVEDQDPWTSTQEITDYTGEVGRDFWHSVQVFNEKIYVIWVGYGSTSEGSDGLGGNTDIFCRTFIDSIIPTQVKVDMAGTNLHDGQLSTALTKVDATSKISGALSSAPTYTDEYGNEFAQLQLTATMGSPGVTIISGLNIHYSAVIQTGNVKDKVNAYLKNHQTDAGDTVRIPVRFHSASGGVLSISLISSATSKAPSFKWDYPGVGGAIAGLGTEVNFAFTLADEDSDAWCNLYLDKDGIPGDEIPIDGAINLTADDSPFTWYIPEDFSTGKYFAVAEFWDGGIPSRSVSVDQLTINPNASKPPKPNWIVPSDDASADALVVDSEARIKFSITAGEDNAGNKIQAYAKLFYKMEGDDEYTKMKGSESMDNYSEDWGFPTQMDENNDGKLESIPNIELIWVTKNLDEGRYTIKVELSDQNYDQLPYECKGVVEIMHLDIETPTGIKLDGGVHMDGLSLHNRFPSFAWSAASNMPSSIDSVGYEVSVGSNLDSQTDVSGIQDVTGATEWQLPANTFGGDGLIPGQTYYFFLRVVGYSGDLRMGDSDWASAGFSISNDPPTITDEGDLWSDTVGVSKTGDYVVDPSDPIGVVEPTMEDPDGDATSFAVRWFLVPEEGGEATAITKYNDMKDLPASETLEGQVWKVQVIPYDDFGGLEYGAGTAWEGNVEVTGGDIVVDDDDDPPITLSSPEYTLTAPSAPGDGETYKWYMQDSSGSKTMMGEGGSEYTFELPSDGVYDVWWEKEDADGNVIDQSEPKSVEYYADEENGDDGNMVMILLIIIIVVVVILVLVIFMKKKKAAEDDGGPKESEFDVPDVQNMDFPNQTEAPDKPQEGPKLFQPGGPTGSVKETPPAGPTRPAPQAPHQAAAGPSPQSPQGGRPPVQMPPGQAPKGLAGPGDRKQLPPGAAPPS